MLDIHDSQSLYDTAFELQVRSADTMPLAEGTHTKDVIQRGSRGSSTLGSTIFFLGRLTDPFVQHGFLAHNWAGPLIERLGGSLLSQGSPLITNTPLDWLNLSPYATIIWLMSAIAMLEQNYHMIFIMQERITPGFGLQFAVMTGIGNTINTILFLCAQTSAGADTSLLKHAPLLVGTMLYVTGILLALGSEQQRCNWKKDPRNKGQVYRSGLFGFSRHINYLGYTTWRAGYALATGGWTWAITNFALASYQFTHAIIPLHERYMDDKYGEQYSRYKDATPYVFMPWIY